MGLRTLSIPAKISRMPEGSYNILKPEKIGLAINRNSNNVFDDSNFQLSMNFKGEVHPKIKVSYLVVFGVLSRMVKVRGACDKPFWVYKRLDKLCRPRTGKPMTF